MLITIIVPVYNIIEYLERCVNSIINQTYKDLEIILVDDGSTDGSGELCDRLALEDSRIRVFHKPNGGSSSARNLGIKESHGEYIGFVDSDDYIDSDFVELMLKAITSRNSDDAANDKTIAHEDGAASCIESVNRSVVFNNGYIGKKINMIQISRDEIAEDGSRLPDVCTPPDGVVSVTAAEALRELLMHRGDCSFCTRLTARSLFCLDSESPRLFPEGKLNEDFYLLVDMLCSGLIEEFKILPKQAYHVFYKSDSNTRTSKDKFSRVFMDIVDNADYMEALVEKQYPQLREVAKRFALFQRLDYMLHIPVDQMRGDNEFYRNVVKYLRMNMGSMLTNRYLTGKNKTYLTLLSVMPVLTRKMHKSIRGL